MSSHHNPAPPRWISQLLKTFGKRATLEEVEGDLDELYKYWLEKEGKSVADRRYVMASLKLLRPFDQRRLEFNGGLTKSHFTVSWRNLVKHSFFNFISLSGLTLGLTVCILIFLFVRDEVSYDKFLPGYEHVVRIQPTVTAGSTRTWATTEALLLPALQSYPEIESSARIMRIEEHTRLKVDSVEFRETGMVSVDSSFFNVFPFPFIKGDRSNFVNDNNSIVMSRAAAARMFGDTDPMGKIIVWEQAVLTVTGVFEDLPSNSHLKIDFAINLKRMWPGVDTEGAMSAFYTYVKLNSERDIGSFQEKLDTDWERLYGHDTKGVVKVRFNVMPLSEIHLDSHAEKEFSVNGNLQVGYIFIAVAILILSIAVINYVNLTNATALKRIREIAVRKAIGASRRRLFVSFLVQSHLFSLVAIVLGLTFAIISLPYFNSITGKSFDWRIVFDTTLVLSVIALWVSMSVLSSLYPSMALASVNAVKILRSGISISRGGRASLYFRRGLLVFQFAIASLLIVGAYTIWSQMNLINGLNPGFDKNNLLVLAVQGDLQKNLDVLKSEVNKVAGVESSTFTYSIPGKRIPFLNVRIPDLANNYDATDASHQTLRVLSVDEDFVNTMKMEIVAGRDFSINNAADRQSAFILNEAAVKALGLTDPVGRPFEYLWQMEKKGQIIGIVKDYNYASIHSRVEPLVIHVLPWYSYLCIRLDGQDLNRTINDVEKVWRSVSSTPFEYTFLDETYDAQYKAERITAEIITGLAILAVIFATLGLFGVVSFFVVQRTREVGIRKVFGASQLLLLKELSLEYIVVVVVGNVLAFIPAVWLIDQWLEKFVVHIELSSFVFLIALLSSVALAACSILHVLLKTTRTSPAIVLRAE
ncbi:MAG TPA: FtsX-like permease family protein [Cyclobacteriaceae bacterium]|nr:FtsX-like permease family protein [Cyclobacteriaceae bacterium]